MFKDDKTLEYAIEIIRVLAKKPGRYDSNTIFQMCDSSGSLSYMKKVLYKMSKIGIVNSDNDGYQLAKNPESMPIAMLFDLLPQSRQGHIKVLEDLLKKQTSSLNVGQIWNL
jgi:DNA-binding IscR family transcriptional regulator